jgi:DNA topoisomerase VI subunit A
MSLQVCESWNEDVFFLLADVVALLRCDRRSLGILASSKGSVVGRLVIEVLWILMLQKAMNELEPTAKELSNSCF